VRTYRIYDAEERELGVIEAFDRYHAREMPTGNGQRPHGRCMWLS
jgi:hypothetical protein